jgi:4-hydroxy-tetrahydrodipicolinate synthase
MATNPPVQEEVRDVTLQLKGIIPALVTPFTVDGEAIDHGRLRSLIDYLIGQGVHGLVALGGTGESVALKPDERRSLLEATVEKADGRVPVLAGILAPGLAGARAEMREAVAADVDGLMVITPYYVSPTQDGLFDAFCALAETTDLPLVLYSIPYRTGVNLQPETVARLADKVPHLFGIKECALELGQTAELIRLTGDRLIVLAGEEYLSVAEWVLGAQGAVLASANLIPQLWCEIWADWQKGNVVAVRQTYLRILPLLRAIFSECNPGPLKTAMSMAGLPAGPVRLPLKQPREETVERLSVIMSELGLLEKHR